MWSQEIGLVSQFFGVSNWCSSLNVVVRKCGNIRKCTRKQTSAQGWSLKIMVKPNLEFLSEPTQFEFVGPLQLQSFTDPKKLGRSKALLFPVSSFAIQPRESSAKSPNIPGDFGPKIFHKIKGGKKKTNGATHQWVVSQTGCTKDLWNVGMFRRDNVTKPTGQGELLRSRDFMASTVQRIRCPAKVDEKKIVVARDTGKHLYQRKCV